MSTMFSRRTIAALASLTLVLLGSACVDSLVGAECARGYVQCGNRCVDLLSDPANCGGCGIVCEEGYCSDGVCSANPPRDAGAGDSDVRDLALDATRVDGEVVDGALVDGEIVDGELVDGEVLDGALVDGEVLDGAVLDGGDADGSVSDFDASSADASTDDAGTDDASTIDAGSRDAAVVDPDAAIADLGRSDLSGFDMSIDLAGLDLGVSDMDVEDLGAPDASDPDMGPIVCDLGELLCDPTCVRPDRDPLNCGDCGIRCGAGELCVDGMCTPLCEDPLTFCSGFCVDLQTDPDHCGSCSTRCPSGLCADGMCMDAPAGHIVVIGHDYVTRRVGMSRIAGNAVFLGSGNPVRVLAYEGFASATSISGTNAAIAQVAFARGRPWLRTTTSADEVSLGLATSDVFLVYAQAGADDATLRALGVTWGVALRTFLRRGGVVVVLETMSANEGTWQILDAAGLFTATSRVSVETGTLRVVSPGDAVAIDVPLMYTVERSTVRFDSTDGTIVVADGVGAVVLHRVVTDL